MTRARIVGVGAYAPKRVLTNADLEKMVETSDEWIVQRTGIRQRHIAEDGEATSDLAVKAAQQALERANLVPEDVEFIVVGTTTPDMIFPSVGNIVQHRLGARRAGSVDMLAACAGSVYSLATGVQFVQTGKYRRVLCIGAETLSKITDLRTGARASSSPTPPARSSWRRPRRTAASSTSTCTRTASTGSCSTCRPVARVIRPRRRPSPSGCTTPR